MALKRLVVELIIPELAVCLFSTSLLVFLHPQFINSFSDFLSLTIFKSPLKVVISALRSIISLYKVSILPFSVLQLLPPDAGDPDPLKSSLPKVLIPAPLPSVLKPVTSVVGRSTKEYTNVSPTFERPYQTYG